jgi:hypothetical protein
MDKEKKKRGKPWTVQPDRRKLLSRVYSVDCSGFACGADCLRLKRRVPSRANRMPRTIHSLDLLFTCEPVRTLGNIGVFAGLTREIDL